MLLLDVVAYLDRNEIDKCRLVRRQWKEDLKGYHLYLQNRRRFSKLRFEGPPPIMPGLARQDRVYCFSKINFQKKSTQKSNFRRRIFTSL
jgi:hypothetical protein